MKKVLFSLVAALGLSSNVNAAALSVVTEVINNTGPNTSATGSISGVYNLAGKELVEGNVVTPVELWGLNENINLSARVYGCQTVEAGSPTGGSCTGAGISDVTYVFIGDAVHYTIDTYSSWMNSPYGNVDSTDVVVELQLSFAVTNTVFHPFDKSIRFQIDNAVWSDIHYKINGGPQQNYRMTKDDHTFIQIVFQALQNGDVIEYRTTSANAQGQVTESAWTSFVVSGLLDLLTPSYDVNQYTGVGTIGVLSREKLDWMDVHYTINGSSQYNYRMSGAQYEFSFALPQDLNAGDVVSYWFTYSLNGQATDTVPQSSTH